MKKEKLKHIAKRITAFAAAAALAAAFTFPVEIGDGIFEGFGNAIVASADTYTAEYDISAGNVTIDANGTYRIYGSTDTNTVTVAAGVSADITLDNVSINVSATDYACAFMIADDSTGDVTIDLVGENTLESGAYCAGLQKNGTYTATLGKLTIKSTSGTGTLTANGGGGGAGIGGGNSGNGSNITISGGTVTANGDNCGAGIGGGNNGDGSYIEISGGTVTANGGSVAAGIGGGANNSGTYGNGSNITISGGTVIATAGGMCAGIGGGTYGNGSKITISGGTVTAIGSSGAGIGGDSASNITISGGTVTAIGDYGGAGIGGKDISGLKVKISGGSVFAKGSVATVNGVNYFGADIGSNATHDSSGNILNGVPVTPTNGSTPVYLFWIENPTGADIKINNVDYPKSHTYYDTSSSAFVTEKNIYAYLPAMTEENPNKITVGDTTTYWYCDTTNSLWVGVDIPVQKDLTVTGGTEGTDYTYENGVLTVKTAVPITVSGTTTRDQIVVESGVSANITLDNVNIDVSGTEYACAFKIEDDSTGNVTIDLVGENTLKSGRNCAGLQKSGSNGSLEIKGTGKLTAIGGYCGAGIGGGKRGAGSNITISSGTVTATGGEAASGIGGGYYSPGSYITISGGTVFANGDEGGAGIGGGSGEDGGDGSGSNITISGGTVTANGGYSGAGIGGGYHSPGSNITISGGTVTANGGGGGAGIGGASYGSGSDITISGGNVTAEGGGDSAGIGGGVYGSGSDITISGGIVTATGGYLGAGIGGGCGRSGSDITISDGNVTAFGGSCGAGIGGGMDSSGSNIIISGGSVYAKGGVNLDDVNFKGADIGGGITLDSSDNWINGVPVTPTNGTISVYLRETENPTGADIQINNADYPKSHTYYNTGNSAFVTEKKIYAYLPAKSPTNPNEVIVGNTTTYCYYDIPNSVWVNVNIVVTHTITATAGAGGSISPSGTVRVASNDSKTFTITPDSGYEIDTLTVDNAVVASATSYTFENITEDHTISVTFKQANTTYLLTVTNGSGSGSYEEGASVTIRANTIAGKVFKEWTVISGNVTIADSTSSTATFTMPASDVEVAATYEDIPAVTHTITATAGAGGSISPSGTVRVASNDSKTFTITPDNGYEIDTLTVDNAVVTSATSYTFENVTEDHTISVTFKLKQSPNKRYDIIVIGNAYADKSSAAAGEIVNVRSDFGYDIIVTTENGRRIAKMTDKGSFIMPASTVYVEAVQNETFALMATAWRNSYVYSYDVDMNKIKVNSTKKRGVIVIDLGEEYADKSFTIYSGRKSTKIKVTEGEFDENGRFVFEVPDGKNYTLVVED